MSYDQVVTLISSVGFPIVMCGYMMISTTKTMNELKETVEKLCDKIDKLTELQREGENIKISKNGIDLIKRFEGCVLKVYLDPIGIKTVGVGHTGKDVNKMKVGQKITQKQADEYLKSDLSRFESAVSKYQTKYKFNQNQYDALVSFAFNVGSIDGLSKNGTRTIKQISDKIPAYNKAGGKVLKGLTTRRLAEQKLFNKAISKTKTKKKEN